MHCLSMSLALISCAPSVLQLKQIWPLQISYNPCPLPVWHALLADICPILTCPRSLACFSLLASTQNMLLRKPDIHRNVDQVCDGCFRAVGYSCSQVWHTRSWRWALGKSPWLFLVLPSRPLQLPCLRYTFLVLFFFFLSQWQAFRQLVPAQYDQIIARVLS